MKKILLESLFAFIFISLLIPNTFGQNVPFPSPGAEWKGEISHLDLYTSNWYTDPIRIKYLGDTSMCGFTYSSFSNGVYTRYDNGKVFQFTSCAQAEYLLYDFSLQLGDTIYRSTMFGQESRHVTNIDSVTLLDGTKRKRLALESSHSMPPISYWIEGIGSSSEPFYEMNFVMVEDGQSLSCYSECGTVLLDSSFNAVYTCQQVDSMIPINYPITGPLTVDTTDSMIVYSVDSNAICGAPNWIIPSGMVLVADNGYSVVVNLSGNPITGGLEFTETNGPNVLSQTIIYPVLVPPVSFAPRPPTYVSHPQEANYVGIPVYQPGAPLVPLIIIGNKFGNPGVEGKANEGNTQNRSTIETEAKLFPNPASESVAISFSYSLTSPLTLDIINLEGKILKTISPEASTFDDRTELEINLENIASGLYYIRIQGGETTQVKKLLVKKN